MLNPFLLFLVVDQLFLNSFPISLSSKIFGTRLIRRRLHFWKTKISKEETKHKIQKAFCWRINSLWLKFYPVKISWHLCYKISWKVSQAPGSSQRLYLFIKVLRLLCLILSIWSWTHGRFHKLRSPNRPGTTLKVRKKSFWNRMPLFSFP